MLAAPSRDWNVFKQIFAEHWDGFPHAHPRSPTPYSDNLVAKMLACGTPEQRGSGAYRCLQWGQGTHRVAMSCQASWCLRCAKVSVDTWGSQVSQVLHEGGIYRHSLLTVPAMCRTPFSQNAAPWLRAFRRCGAPCLDDVYSAVRGKALRGGSLVGLHTPGRKGQDHPPLHLLATSGGDDEQGERWAHLQYLPSKLRQRPWQWHLRRLVRQTLQTEGVNQGVERCCKPYPNGLVRNVPKGNVPSQ